MSPNIIKVQALKNYKLLITFSNKEIKIFDMVPYLKYPIFKPLYDEEVFKKFSIIDGTIEWECGADLSNDTFYLAGVSSDNSLLEM